MQASDEGQVELRCQAKSESVEPQSPPSAYQAAITIDVLEPTTTTTTTEAAPSFEAVDEREGKKEEEEEDIYDYLGRQRSVADVLEEDKVGEKEEEEDDDDEYYGYDDENYMYEYPDDSSELQNLSREEIIHPELLHEETYSNNVPGDKKRRKEEDSNDVYPKDSPYTAGGAAHRRRESVWALLLLVAGMVRFAF